MGLDDSNYYPNLTQRTHLIFNLAFWFYNQNSLKEGQVVRLGIRAFLHTVHVQVVAAEVRSGFPGLPRLSFITSYLSHECRSPVLTKSLLCVPGH